MCDISKTTRFTRQIDGYDCFNFRISKRHLATSARVSSVHAYATHIRVYRGRSLITVALPVHRKSFIPYYYIVIPVFSPSSPSLIIYFLHSARRRRFTRFFSSETKERREQKKKKKKFTNIRRTRESGWKDDGRFRPRSLVRPRFPVNGEGKKT